MQLSVDQMRVLSASLRVSEDAGYDSERRRTGRVDVRATVGVQLIVDGQRGEKLSLRMHDLSPRGVSLFHTTPLEIGQQFVITLPRQSGPDVSILCTTVHVHRRGGGTLYMIGAEFTCALSETPDPATANAAEQERIRQSVLG